MVDLDDPNRSHFERTGLRINVCSGNKDHDPQGRVLSQKVRYDIDLILSLVRSEISDVRSTADYRRAMTGVLLRRVLESLR